MEKNELLSRIVKACPSCTDIREQVAAINASLADKQTCGVPIPDVNHIQIQCSACNNTGKVLTKEGRDIADAVVEALGTRLRTEHEAIIQEAFEAINRLEAFARNINVEAAEAAGIKDSIPF